MPQIVLDQIVLRRHPSQPPVLDGVSVSIERGDAVALVGANGSGKSTLARVLAGVLLPESGRVLRGDGRGGQPRVGLVLQDPAAQAIASTVADDVAFGPESQGLAPPVIAARVVDLLHQLELAPMAARDPAQLSGGQQQRLAIASILACDIDVLVLDEPTAHLDPPARARLVTYLLAAMSSGLTVVWITQEPSDQAWCARTVALDTGTVAFDGLTSDYVQQPQLAAALGVELPPASRVAHELARAGAWPRGVAIPVTMDDLMLACGAQGPGGSS